MDPQGCTLKIYGYTITCVDAIAISKIRGHEFEGEWGKLRGKNGKGESLQLNYNLRT